MEVTLMEEGVGYQVRDCVAVWNEHVPSYWPRLSVRVVISYLV